MDHDELPHEAEKRLERFILRTMLVVMGLVAWVGLPLLCAYEGVPRTAWAQTVDFYRWLGEEWRAI